jgi:SAM-dependent methyltransferase
VTDTWGDIHKKVYAGSEWVDKPSLFAETALGYFPQTGRVLELGAGQGQDGRFFAARGYEVVSTDLEQTALDLSKQKLPMELRSKLTLQRVDLCQTLPFEGASFDVVYAHLALHYFDAQTTERIFSEINRVLRPGGTLAFLVNSTSDPEYGTGRQIEPDYFHIEGMSKRYFTVLSAGTFTNRFVPVLLDDKGETYKDMAKDVHNLIRFIGTKPE